MDDIVYVTGLLVVVLLLGSAQAFGLRLQFWKAPNCAPALDAQIHARETARFDPLSSAALFAAMAFGMVEDGDVPYGKPLLYLIWLLLTVGFFLKHSTMPPKNVLARRYIVGNRILILTLIVALLGIAYLTTEPLVGEFLGVQQ
jgi:hypothetical protein